MKKVQCNLDLVTLNLVTILQRPFFNLLHKIIRFCDIMRFSDSFCRDQCTVGIKLYCAIKYLWQVSNLSDLSNPIKLDLSDLSNLIS